MSTLQMPRIRRRNVVRVFNPMHKSDDVMVNGTFFHFDPRSVGQCICSNHQKDVGEDPTGVHELRDWPRTERGEVNNSGGPGSRVIAAEGSMTADKVAEYIVSPDCRGDKGFVILDGSPAEQEEQKRAAIEKWARYFLAQCEDEIARWEQHVGNMRAARPGDPPPRRTKRVIEAYEFRDEHLALMGRRAQFICDLCGWEAEDPVPDTAQSLGAHIARSHAGVANEGARAVAIQASNALNISPPPAAAPEPLASTPAGEAGVTTGGGEPETTDGEDFSASPGAALLLRAKTLGLNLSVADTKGLSHDDADVIADVQERLKVYKAGLVAAAARSAADKRARR
jgi:hypothetical protein